MYQDITRSMFIDEFRSFEESSGRYSQMGGYKGLSVLFDYLEELEEEMGEDIEVDVIALCCDFTQYNSLEDLQADYKDIETMDDLRDTTQVIEYDNGKLIIQEF